MKTQLEKDLDQGILTSIKTLTEFRVYSFNGNKIITTSGGGLLVSSDKDLIKKAQIFSCTRLKEIILSHYEHTHIGYNYRLSNVSAAIGLGQIEILDQKLKRREIFNHYVSQLSNINEISFQEETENFYSNR